MSRALDPDGTADFELTNTDLTYHDRYSNALGLTAQVSYVNVRSNLGVTGFPPGAFGGAFPDGARQDLGLDEDRVRAELTALWTGLEQHWIRAGLGGVFESSDTTEDVRNYTVRQGFPVPTGVFAERGGIDDVPIFPDEDRTIFFAYLQDEWDFAPDWRLTTGVRIDEYSDFGTTVNPRVELVWNTAYRLTTKLPVRAGLPAPIVRRAPFERSLSGTGRSGSRACHDRYGRAGVQLPGDPLAFQPELLRV